MSFGLRQRQATKIFCSGNTYTNDLQEPFSVRTFKFYIGSVRFINDSTGSSYQANKNQYYLVNFADSASLSLPLSVTAGQYSRIAFTLGVDSLHNVSGAQTGALDPANGMFWTWNSGYLMAKLEGYSTVFTQPNNIYEYHIGGFKGAENVVQDVSLYLPAGDIIDTQKGKISSVTVAADVLQWFSGSYPVSIATTPVCTTPGPLAVKIAGNYSTMFTVEKVVNQ